MEAIKEALEKIRLKFIGLTPQERKRWLYMGGGALGVVILIILLATLIPASASPEGVMVSIDAPAEVSAGSDFIARVSIGETAGLDSTNYDVIYDPAVIQITAISDGSMGGTEVPIELWDFIPPATQGKVRIVNNMPQATGISNSGYLAELHFHVIGSAGQTSAIGFAGSCGLYDNTATEITATWEGGSVQVK